MVADHNLIHQRVDENIADVAGQPSFSATDHCEMLLESLNHLNTFIGSGTQASKAIGLHPRPSKLLCLEPRPHKP